MIWLIAEDEADIRNLIALMCQVWGHTPLAFENGQKVWDWLDTVEGGQQTQLPDLILMDIRMPGKKGNELAHRMRTIASLQQTPIVLMTAFSLSEQERGEMITGDGVDQIISKPLPDFEQLRAVLDDIIKQKKEKAQETPPAPSTESSPTAPTQEQPAPVTDNPTPTEQPPAADDTTEPDQETLIKQQPTPAEVSESPTKAQETTVPPTLQPQTKEADQT